MPFTALAAARLEAVIPDTDTKYTFLLLARAGFKVNS
jgi:hypothetical protein